MANAGAARGPSCACTSAPQNILTTFAEWNGTLDNDIYVSLGDAARRRAACHRLTMRGLGPLPCSRATKRTNERVGTYAADIRPKEAFAAFAETHKLDDVDVWRQPVKPVQYSYANGPLARIVMDGMMLRQAGTVSTFWRTCTGPCREHGARPRAARAHAT